MTENGAGMNLPQSPGHHMLHLQYKTNTQEYIFGGIYRGSLGISPIASFNIHYRSA